MANEPLRRTRPRPEPPQPDRPKIWAEGDQRPPFTFRGLRRATLYLSRAAVAPLNAWAARTTRRVAVNVSNGAGRIPEGKLGRVERFVPSHLRVAGWIKNSAAVLAHASAVADTDFGRGNALVAEIEPHLWPVGVDEAPAPRPQETVEPIASPFGADAPAPVVLAEPVPPEPERPEADPLAAIRDDLDGAGKPARKAKAARYRPPSGPALPPDPPGPFATTAIQVTGYLVGWATVIIALPYGLVRSLWLWRAKSVDLRRVGLDD
ncbi:MAG: hypothetical protein NTW20_08680 [Rhodobacterales bacterium]|nr:hypothetical protein [Rhodobacterales bacterium]